MREKKGKQGKASHISYIEQDCIGEEMEEVEVEEAGDE